MERISGRERCLKRAWKLPKTSIRLCNCTQAGLCFKDEERGRWPKKQRAVQALPDSNGKGMYETGPRTWEAGASKTRTSTTLWKTLVATQAFLARIRAPGETKGGRGCHWAWWHNADVEWREGALLGFAPLPEARRPAFRPRGQDPMRRGKRSPLGR